MPTFCNGNGIYADRYLRPDLYYGRSDKHSVNKTVKADAEKESNNNLKNTVAAVSVGSALIFLGLIIKNKFLRK